jgi:hypothetical protein
MKECGSDRTAVGVMKGGDEVVVDDGLVVDSGLEVSAAHAHGQATRWGTVVHAEQCLRVEVVDAYGM